MPKHFLAVTALLALLAVSLGCQSKKAENPTPGMNADSLNTAAAAPASDSTAGMVMFTDIKPILDQNCVGCHAWMKSSQSLLAQKSKGPSTKDMPIVSVSKPDSSVIIWRLEGKLPSGAQLGQMPKGKAALPAETIGKIRAWIQQGAMDGPMKM